jgi:hypothetical protein
MRDDGFTCETLAEFLEQVSQFYTHMGSRSIMQDEERREGIFKGLSLMYLRLPLKGEELDRAARAYETASLEFAMRLEYPAEADPSREGVPREPDDGNF